jgi:hypothetical protein
MPLPGDAAGGSGRSIYPDDNPRLGYCEYNCTPVVRSATGAIPDLTPLQKKREVIGKAVLDKTGVSFRKKINCIVCEEHCPIPQKAIRFEEVMKSTRRVTEHSEKPYVWMNCATVAAFANISACRGKSAIEVTAVKTRLPSSNGFLGKRQ